MIKKVDANQKELMTKLRLIPGVTVATTHIIGKGFPDIVIGYKGINYLVEIKDGTKPPSQRKLTKDEVSFHSNWSGQVQTCTNFYEILQLLNIKL
ncbi:hypothetical protein UFOVP208_10 [uncultured Caudovirales phage]|uniref:VRR-NUC domain containing protein n=1 Tax=uncultured Caudovirales phage TaxID=2100421 RepID=A0A6J7WM97_9CAUD|nr:hypothetical protein UFOVP208_10 [uncultured Caudovirales phage]